MKNVCKKLAVASLVALSAISLCACQKTTNNGGNNIAVEQDVNGSNGQKINEKDSTATAEKQISKEYTEKHVNENGVTIYGKIVDENTASEAGKKVIQANKLGDKQAAREGYTYTYSEYYSEAYGGTVILKTGNKEGSISIYNENGQCFISGKKPQNDMETLLSNYRISNAMADAMNKKYKNK